MNQAHSQPDREEGPSYSLPNDSNIIKGPAKVWLSIFAVFGLGVVAWTRSEMNRDADAKRIDQQQAELREFRNVVQQVRDASSEIKANAASMQRQLDRMDRMSAR